MGEIDWEDIGKTFAFVLFIVCVIIGIYFMVHFASKEKNDNIAEASSNSRFETIETRMITASASYRIVYDKQTKIIYSIDSTGKFTPLIDENGDPLIYNDKYIE